MHTVYVSNCISSLFSKVFGKVGCIPVPTEQATIEFQDHNQHIPCQKKLCNSILVFLHITALNQCKFFHGYFW